MNCSEARDLLSPYLDGELPEATRSLAVAHFESCSKCAAELASFERLGQSAGELNHPHVPAEVWRHVAADLDAEMPSLPDEQGARPATHKAISRWMSVAALFLVVATLGYLVYHNHHHTHGELAADFSEYLDVFRETPTEAHLVLVNKYDGETVELEEAQAKLGYLPTLADGLPDGYAIQTAYVMDMPCCKCIKCVCKGPDGSTIAIFEHNDEQPIWFGDRESMETTCGGKACTVTQLENRIAVSWKQGKRHLTVVGAKDVEEAASIIRHLSRTTPGVG